MKVFGRTKNEAFVGCAFEVVTNAFEGGNMTFGRFERVSRALADSKGNVGASVT